MSLICIFNPPPESKEVFSLIVFENLKMDSISNEYSFCYGREPRAKQYSNRLRGSWSLTPFKGIYSDNSISYEYPF